MRLERYTLEERTANHWRRPEWAQFAGKEFRYPATPPVERVSEEARPTGQEVFPLATGQPGVAQPVEVFNGK